MSRSRKYRERRGDAATEIKSAPLDASLRPSFELFGLALIVLAMFVVYWPSMHGGMVFDDDFYLTRADLQSSSGLVRIWFDPLATAQYYPLVHTAFSLEHKLWGDNYVGYHVANVVWQALAVCLLYVILKRLKVPGALLAAALFALHPVIVESVSWMTEQKNTLSAVFYLSAMLAYIEFDASRRRSQYFLALGLFAAALLTKTATVSLPVALLLIFWWQRGSLAWRRDVLSLAPFFAIAVSAGLMTVWVERMHGARGADFGLSLAQRTLVAGRAIWFYLAKLAWPSDLMFIYPRWQPDVHEAWQWIYPLAAVATSIFLWAIRGRWRAPLAAWLFFCITLFPVLGFFNVYYFTYSFVADHFQYLACLGIFALVGAGVAQELSHLAQPLRYAGVALCAVLVAYLATLSHQQTPMYTDIATLYQTTIERNPTCWLAHNNLGRLFADSGRADDAIAHYRAAIEIKPDYADAHNNLANAMSRAGRMQDALNEFQIAINLDARDPVYHNNLASALVQLGRYPEAIAECRDAIRLDPNNFEARLNLGVTLFRAGKFPEAIDEVHAAQALRPDDAMACNALGAILLQAGRTPEAIQQLEQALRLRPNYPEAHSNLASALLHSGQAPLAVSHYREAIALNDKYADAHFGLGQALEAQGKFDDAIQHLSARFNWA